VQDRPCLSQTETGPLAGSPLSPGGNGHRTGWLERVAWGGTMHEVTYAAKQLLQVAKLSTMRKKSNIGPLCHGSASWQLRQVRTPSHCLTGRDPFEVPGHRTEVSPSILRKANGQGMDTHPEVGPINSRLQARSATYEHIGQQSEVCIRALQRHKENHVAHAEGRRR
jgi:hypothetical protein